LSEENAVLPEILLPFCSNQTLVQTGTEDKVFLEILTVFNVAS